MKHVSCHPSGAYNFGAAPTFLKNLWTSYQWCKNIRRPTFVLWKLKILDPQYETPFVSPIWGLKFWSCYYIFEKFVDLCLVAFCCVSNKGLLMIAMYIRKVLCTLGWIYTAGIWLYCDFFIWVYLVLWRFYIVL